MYESLLVEYLVKERLARLREASARQVRLRSLRPSRRPLRIRVGLALIRLGRFIRGSAPGWAREPAPDGSRGRYA